MSTAADTTTTTQPDRPDHAAATMTAAVHHRFGPPDVIELDEVARPTPADDEVLIRVRAVAVSSADATARRGEPWYARPMWGLRTPKHPILGTELAGQVAAVGSQVEGFAVGDHVVAATGDSFGGHAEFIALPQDAAIGHLPADLDYADAVGIYEGALTALTFLRDTGRLESGQRLLVVGASGAVGSAAVQLGRYLGAHVTAVTSTGNVELVRSLGADEVIDYKHEDVTATGEQFDVIFDTVAGTSYRQMKSSLTRSGRYLGTVVGGAILAQTLWTRLTRRTAAITFTGMRSAADKTADMAVIRQAIDEGRIRGVVGRRFRPDEFVEAYRYVETGRKVGSAVVEFDDEEGSTTR